ncbi:LacI family transcriptional regulator [Cupriavidus necator]|uniref:LacI family transcriptional regulator n=1 Tax=Cupriavidus necator TaxID=106590 RepID=A0A1U9V0Y1_CUPNE|nr:tripartite tricarboxylate transporter substrate binding protein [Cupriavidus necator]AQV98590.1 LacI family transcriptional regulator [Cupriavidus necator]
MEIKRRRVLAALSAMAGWPLARAAGVPAGWPQKPIRLVLPYAAGGPTDAVARALAAKMSQQLGQPVVVDNRTGASGNIACEYVARSAPDGYTVLYHSSGLAISPALYRRLSYDPLKDFAPVAMTATIPAVLMVNPSLPATNIEQFVQYLKAHPGQLSYGTGGVGNITHLGVALFLQAKGLQAIHVPYKGTAPAMTDLIGGQTQFMLDAVSSALPYIRDKRVRALAVTSRNRVSVLAGVPALGESVMPGFAAPTWHGMLVPAGTPAAIVQRLNAAANKAVGDPEIGQQFAPQGVALQTSTPEQFAAYLRGETERWASAARAAGVEPE